MKDLWRAPGALVDNLCNGFRKGFWVGARAPTPITVQLSLHCLQLRQLIERSAFVRSGRHGSSYLEHVSPAESRIVAGASVFVENGAPATRTSGDTKASAIARRLFAEADPEAEPVKTGFRPAALGRLPLYFTHSTFT